MTMQALEIHSEPYGSTGNIGENFRRLLGAPTLDPLQTVIREAVQNIADAAKPGSGPEILIRLRALAPGQRESLAGRVLRELPQEPASATKILETLDSDQLIVLEICDFGTVGLGGPTRSDRIPVGTDRTDFIDFLRNIGTPRDTVHGGGTYGFGKVALYRASACSTIIVDSLPCGLGPEGRRLMACHVGRSFEIPENDMLRRFTGRHWWGVRDPSDGIADPLTSSHASELARSLGLPHRLDGQSGTSIMILGFQSEDTDLSSTANRIVEMLLWNFWPRMMRDVHPAKGFRCRVMVEDVEIAVPEPDIFAPFDLFCKAMRGARTRQGHDVREIQSRSPAKFLGTLALEKGLRSPRRPLVDSGRLVPEQLHHIALMRPVELVVKYLEGNPLPDDKLEWAGVFLASDEAEVERAFADSEPPAHDDWNPSNLPKGRPRLYVNVALSRLRDAAADMGLVGPSRPVGTAGPPLARLAGRLGAVLDKVGGNDAGRRRSTGRRGGTRPLRATATRPVFERLELGAAGRIAIFSTDVVQDPRDRGAALIASASVAVEGSGLGQTAGLIPEPKVLSVKWRDSETIVEGGELELAGREGRVEIRVQVPGDCAVKASADVRSDIP